MPNEKYFEIKYFGRHNLSNPEFENKLDELETVMNNIFGDEWIGDACADYHFPYDHKIEIVFPKKEDQG